MKDDQNDIVKEIIPSYLAGEASAADEKRVQQWIAEAPENEKVYLDLRKIFELSEKHYAQRPDINIDEEWNHFVDTIGKKETKTINFSKATSATSGMWYKVAAAILVLIVSGFIINYLVSDKSDVQYKTAGNTQQVSLPDGSNITLNRNSSLSYAADFGETDRNVTLKGEAFFEVAHNAAKPFIIKTDRAQVEVLGTSFNVRAYDSLETIEVVVQTGLVKFSSTDAHQEIKLKAGEKGLFTKSKSQLNSKVNDDVNYLAWNTRKIIFEETDLRTVVEQLNTIYHAHIIVADTVPASCLVTVTFDKQTLEAVLHVLETTLNLTYQTKDGTVEITSASGC